jgi:hypothetical protein
MMLSASYPVAPAPVAFGRLNLFLGLLWKRDASSLAMCDFCHTLNHGNSSRCEACAGKLPAIHTGGAEEVRGTIDPTALCRRAAKRFVRMARAFVGWIAMLMLLSIGVAAWHPFGQVGVEAYPLERSTLARMSVSSAPQTGPDGASGTAPNPGENAARLEIAGRDDNKEASRGKHAQHEAATPPGNPRRTPYRAVNSMSVAGARPPTYAVAPRAGLDPAGACEKEVFLLRAVCMNRVCAEVRNARHPSCFEAVRQRRIDEERRDPLLAG